MLEKIGLHSRHSRKHNWGGGTFIWSFKWLREILIWQWIGYSYELQILWGKIIHVYHLSTIGLFGFTGFKINFNLLHISYPTRSGCRENSVCSRPAYLTEDWFIEQFLTNKGCVYGTTCTRMCLMLHTTWSVKVFRFEQVATWWLRTGCSHLMPRNHVVRQLLNLIVEASWIWLLILVFGLPNLGFYCPIFSWLLSQASLGSLRKIENQKLKKSL